MNDLYCNKLSLFQNFFQPSLKLMKKVRVASKVVRKYDKAQTPFERVLKSKKYYRAKIKKLKELFSTLDPFELSGKIDQKLQHLFKMASEHIQASQRVKEIQKQAQDTPNSPWRNWTFSRKIALRKKIITKAPYKPFKEAA